MRALRLVHVLHRVCARPQSCLTAGMFPSKWYDPARRLPELSRLKRAICLNLPTLTVHFVALNEKDANRRAAQWHGGKKKCLLQPCVSIYSVGMHFSMGLLCCLYVFKEMKWCHGSFPGSTKQRFYRNYFHRNSREYLTVDVLAEFISGLEEKICK